MKVIKLISVFDIAETKTLLSLCEATPEVITHVDEIVQDMMHQCEYCIRTNDVFTVGRHAVRARFAVVAFEGEPSCFSAEDQERAEWFDLLLTAHKNSEGNVTITHMPYVFSKDNSLEATVACIGKFLSECLTEETSC